MNGSDLCSVVKHNLAAALKHLQIAGLLWIKQCHGRVATEERCGIVLFFQSEIWRDESILSGRSVLFILYKLDKV